MNQEHILYGVGQAIMRDFVDNTKVVGYSQLKDLTVSQSGTDEKIFGGDNPYPITKFQKEKTITITGTNATISLPMINVTQGASLVTGAVDYDEMLVAAIPSGATPSITVERLAKADSVQVIGMNEAATLVGIATGEYFQDSTDPKIVHFHASDAGKEVTIVYVWATSTAAETLSVKKDSIPKTFRFAHRIPIYDSNSQVVGQGQLVVFKAQSNSAFEFNLASQTAFAPKFALEALDPKRADKKLWDFTIDPVA